MAQPITDRPERSVVSQLLSRYATAHLGSAIDLVDRDRLALQRLAHAATWIDRIYWKQRSEEGWLLKERLSASESAESRDLERLVDLSYGPWDVFDNDRPFWGAKRLSPGGNLYPPTLTREEFQAYLASHPDQREALMSPTTVVRRDSKGLVAIPYADIYREELEQVAAGLADASRQTTHPGFAAFLTARAHDLVTGSLDASEARWLDIGDSQIDIAVGPYELYDDTLMGLKTSYEATVMVRHPMTDRLSKFEAVASELGQRLPGAVSSSDHRQRVVIGVYDVVYAAGRANMGAKAIAAMLPNDERVRRKFGSRLLLFRNVIAAKFMPILKPVADRLLRSDQAKLVDEEAFISHTLLHEMAHALAAGVEEEGTTETTNERLRERYSTIEECRADLVGLVLLDLLSHRGVFKPAMAPAAAATFVASILRTLRFGAENDYGRAAAIILTGLMRSQALTQDHRGMLVLDVAGVYRAANGLAQLVQHIATAGDYDAAGALVADLGSVPSEIHDLLPRLEDIPIDLEFVFDESLDSR